MAQLRTVASADLSRAELTALLRPYNEEILRDPAILLLVGVGILAGLAPAVRAARITPIEAMRAE